MILSKINFKFYVLIIIFLKLFFIQVYAAGSHDHLSHQADIKIPNDNFRKYLYYYNLTNWQGLAKKTDDNGKILYEVKYTIDNDHLRFNPYNQKNTSETNLVFVGCSVTFGEGLNDDQTIPAQVALYTQHTKTFNYGTSGYGPTHVLSYFKYFNLAKRFTQPKNVKAIYIWGDYLIMRAVGSLDYLRWGGDIAPYYKMSPTGLKLSSSLSKEFPIENLISKVIFSIPYLGKYLIKSRFDWPLYNHYSDQDIDLIIQILKETKEHYQRQFGNDQFYIAFYPFSDYSISKLQLRLNQIGIKTINLASAYENVDISKIFIPGDLHPSPYGAHLLALELIKKLGLK